MKTRFVACALLATTSILFAADAGAVDGKWQVHTIVYGNESDSVCTFTQKEAELTGTCELAGAPVDITGKIDGEKVTWIQKGEYNGTALTMTFVGTLKEDALKGTVTVDPFGVDGEFSATRPK